MSNATAPAPASPPPPAPSQTLSEKQMHKALAHHQSGRLKEAEEYYKQVLRLQPNHPDANNLLGVLLFQTNRSQDGLKFLDKATKLKPQEAMFYYNYGIALRSAGDQVKAIEALTRAIQLNPDHADALSQLIDIHQKRHEWERAISLLKQLANLRSLDTDSFKRLGEALHQTKNYAEAATYLSKAAGLAPEDAAIHHQLGLSLQAAGDNKGAAVAYKRSLELNPDLAPAHNNLAIVLAEQGHNEEAVKHYEQALEMNSKLFQTKCNLGGLLRKMGRLEESIEWLRSAVEQKSDCAEALCNLGNTYGDMGESQSAMECYRKAILCQADYTQARLNRAIGLLRREEFSEGWMEYEWRWKLKECPRRNFGKPRWDGRELKENEVLLVHAEQGLGDTLQMVRYIKQLKSRGTRIVLECQKALVPFLTLNEVADTVLPIGDKYPEYDFHIPLMSLPSLLFEKLGFASDNVPYLRASEELSEHWEHRLHDISGRKVGIFWQGNPEFKQDQFRSIPLETYSALAKIPDVQLISLQKGTGIEQVAKFTVPDALHCFDDLDADKGAFMDSAAIIQHLDLIVTSDSAVAHLAGSLGITTYLLLPFASDWRWFVDREDSPWYPSITLVRKRRNETWQEAMSRVIEAIEKR